MADTCITARKVVTPDGTIGPAAVTVRSGRIASVELLAADAASSDVTLVPGFIDLQVNGVGAHAVSSADGADWTTLCDQLESTGVSGWLPTVVTRPLSSYRAVFDRIESALSAQARCEFGGARMLGVHLEGPFLGDRPGAHRADQLIPPDPTFVAELPEYVALMTIGAEQPGAVAATSALVSRGVRVALGHTAATHAQLDACLEAGASLVTHLFNAMSPVHHRDDGVASWALTSDSIFTSVIADGHHVNERALAIAIRCKPSDRLVAVTDRVAHQRPGLHGGNNGRPVLLSDGTLAGSTTSMDACFRNLIAAGADLETAVRATSTNPAALLGVRDEGCIAPGMRANLVSLDTDLHIAAVHHATA